MVSAQPTRAVALLNDEQRKLSKIAHLFTPMRRERKVLAAALEVVAQQ